MNRILTYLVFFSFLSTVSFSQIKVIKPVKKRPKSTNLGIGGGFTNSQLFLTQNVKEHNGAGGFNGTITYGGTATKNLRASFEYTRYNTIDIAPTWYNIKAHTIEVNFHILFKCEPINTFFYPIFGLSYNVFSGYFTGRDDFLNLRAIYHPDALATKRWLGANAGLGTEVFIKRVSIYAEAKMRVGTAEGNRNLTVMDICGFIGLRYNLKVPTLHRLFRGTRSRYALDTEPVSK